MSEQWVDVTKEIKGLVMLDLEEFPYRVRKVKLRVAEAHTLAIREQWAFIVERKEP